MTKEMEDRVQNAVELFMEGYNCSQSVVAAFSDLYGISKEDALRMSAGFGGGVGRLRMMCGTVSGMVMLAGLAKGCFDPKDNAAKGEVYKTVQELLAEFKENNGSIICAELLGLDANTPITYHPSERNAAYYKARPCARKVESAARIFAEWYESN